MSFIPPKLQYLFYFFVIIFLAPFLTSLLNYWFFKDVMLSYKASIDLLLTGQIHYGYAKYLTYPFQFFLNFLAIRMLLKRFLIFDFEAKRFNQMVIIFILFLSGLLLEYILEGISNKGQWWVYTNYQEQMQAWNFRLAIFLIPSFIEGGLIYGFILIFAKLSDLDPVLKSLKFILKKNQWTENELQEVLSYRFEKFFVSEEYALVTSAIETKRGKRTFFYKDLSKFDAIFTKKENIF